MSSTAVASGRAHGFTAELSRASDSVRVHRGSEDVGHGRWVWGDGAPRILDYAGQQVSCSMSEHGAVLDALAGAVLDDLASSVEEDDGG